MSDILTQHPLDAPVVLEQAIRNANFFNGRVLTARDMQDEQTANRRQHRQLGQAIGAGVVNGLKVRLVDAGAPDQSAGTSSRTPVVAVTGGLAINREGQAIELPVGEVHVALRRSTGKPPAVVHVFADCKPLQAAPDLVGKGVYLLTAAPAAQYSDRAPMVSLNGGGKADGCGDRYAVEGVRFGLVELNLATLAGLSDATRAQLATLLSRSEQNNLNALERLTARSRLRNLLAHACFGSERVAGLATDPLHIDAQQASFGALDALWDAGALDSCELPLALLIWTSAGLRALDMWAVRRQATAPRDTLAPFVPHDATQNIAAAMIAQFQDHVADLAREQRTSGLLGAMRMVDLFRYLPPCGALPLARTGEPGPPTGFVPEQFFNGAATRPAGYIEGAQLEGLYREALGYPALDLTSGEFCWLYRTRENGQAASAGGLPLLYFAYGHLAYRGDGRVNLARLGYSNVASLPTF